MYFYMQMFKCFLMYHCREAEDKKNSEFR
jgi:hypothetical protein